MDDDDEDNEDVDDGDGVDGDNEDEVSEEITQLSAMLEEVAIVFPLEDQVESYRFTVAAAVNELGTCGIVKEVYRPDHIITPKGQNLLPKGTNAQGQHVHLCGVITGPILMCLPFSSNQFSRSEF